MVVFSSWRAAQRALATQTQSTTALVSIKCVNENGLARALNRVRRTKDSPRFPISSTTNRQPIRGKMHLLRCPAASRGVASAAAAPYSSAGVLLLQRAICRPGAGAQHWHRRGRPSASASATGDADRDAASNGEDELARLLKADMERFASGSATSSAPSTSGAPQQQKQQQQAQQASGEESSEGGLKAALDKLLIADFFAVLAALAWLGAGLAERAAFGSTRLVDAWMPLWPLLWQPIIGVLMLGALVSGGAGWLASKQQEQQQQGGGRR